MIARASTVLGLAAAALCSAQFAVAQLPAVAAERSLATELGLRVGDTVQVGASPDAVRLRVVIGAIYEPRPDPAEIARGQRHVRMHLPDLAALLGAADRVDRIGVGARAGVPAESVAAALDRTAFGYQAYSSAAIAAESSQTFTVVSRFHRAIGVITIVASAIFLLCIMVLKVEERRFDAAAMRLVGVRQRTIVGALLLEAVLIAALGSSVGVALAYAAQVATNRYYQRFFDTTLIFSRITGDIVAFGVALSVVLGVAAGAIAAWRLAKTHPMALWRRG